MSPNKIEALFAILDYVLGAGAQQSGDAADVAQQSSDAAEALTLHAGLNQLPAVPGGVKDLTDTGACIRVNVNIFQRIHINITAMSCRCSLSLLAP